MSKNQKATDRTPLRTSEQTERIRNQVEQIKDTLRDNIDLAIEHGGDLEDLNDFSEQMEADSRTFKQRAHIIKRRSCQQYYKTIFIGVLIAIALGLALYFIFR